MRLLAALFLISPLLAGAAETPEEGVHLDVKPLLCIVDRSNPACDMAFDVLWRSALSGYYCLFNDFEESPLRCWQDVRAGRTSDQRTVDESFSFWLTGEDAGRRLAEVEIEVLRMDAGDRRRRRRTRHVWDIN